MKRWGIGLSAVALAALAAGPAGAQTLSHDRQLLGSWTCSVAGVPEIERANGQFEPGGIMLLTFFNNHPDVQMAFVLSGLWSYDSVQDKFSHTVRGARIKDIVVRGKPFARSQFPGGEAAVRKIEDDFMVQYSSATFSFQKVTATELVLTDTDNARLTCAR